MAAHAAAEHAVAAEVARGRARRVKAWRAQSGGRVGPRDVTRAEQ